MKIVVTGATGYIGRHVMSELRRRSIVPTMTVRPGHPHPIEFGADVVACDIATPPENVFETLGRPDILIHLAWGGLPHYTSMRHVEEELPAQYRFLRGMITAGVRHCVVTGTCLEYGLQAGELHEDAVTAPTTPYGFAKDALRRQLEFLRAERPFSLTWARLFYSHGDGQPATSLYPQLRTAVLRGDHEFDMSRGEQLRDYLPVEQMAQALVSLALKTEGAGIVNICSGQPISVRRLVEGWIEQNGWAIKLHLGRYSIPTYEPLAFWGARHKLDSLLSQS